MYVCVQVSWCPTLFPCGGQRSAFRSRVLFFHVFRLVVVCLYQVNHLAGPWSQFCFLRCLSLIINSIQTHQNCRSHNMWWTLSRFRALCFLLSLPHSQSFPWFPLLYKVSVSWIVQILFSIYSQVTSEEVFCENQIIYTCLLELIDPFSLKKNFKADRRFA